MKREDYDFYIILDLGGGMSRELRKAFDERWAIIDHHRISKDEMGTDFTDHIFNSWSYGIDGGREISAGGMAYLAHTHLKERIGICQELQLYPLWLIDRTKEIRSHL